MLGCEKGSKKIDTELIHNNKESMQYMTINEYTNQMTNTRTKGHGPPIIILTLILGC